MSDMMRISLEMGLLTFLGVLYYLFQRGRIIRNDLAEIYHLIEKYIFHINDFLDDKKNESYYQELNAYAEKLERLNEAGDIHVLYSFLEKVPNGLPKELEADLETIMTQLKFHHA